MIKLSNCNLRPHHSLCIEFFEGKGYSEEFVSSMTEIIRSLNSGNPLVTLVSGCDIICESCPNNSGGLCSECEKVSRFDRNCLKEYGLNFGNTIRWLDLKELASSRIIDKNKIKSVCKNCGWLSICQN